MQGLNTPYDGNARRKPERRYSPANYGAIGSEPFGPLLPPMKNRKQFQPLASNAVRDDIRSAWNDQFACAGNSSGSTHFGM